MPSIVDSSLLERASGLIQSYAFDEAQDVLKEFAQQTLQLSSTDRPLSFWRNAAEILRDAGMPEAAEQAWLHARERKMAAYAAETEILSGYVLCGRYQEVWSRLTALREEHPKNAVVRNLYAIALFESGDHQKALEDWQACRGISAQTDCPLSTHPFYLSLGAMAIERFLLEQDAANRFTQSSDIGSSQSEKAPGRSQRKRMEQIERAWDEGRYEQALSWTEGEIGAEKATADLRMVRALILGGLNRWSEARKEVVAVLEEDPKNAGAQSYLAYALIHSGESGTALALLDRIEPAGPDDYFSNYIRGCGWIGFGDRLRAAQSFHTAFTDYFFDSYHSVLVPAWKRTVRLLEASR